MSPPGRPKGESFARQREGNGTLPPGRPKGESFARQREGNGTLPPGRPKGEFFARQREGSPMKPPRAGAARFAFSSLAPASRRGRLRRAPLAAATGGRKLRRRVPVACGRRGRAGQGTRS